MMLTKDVPLTADMSVAPEIARLAEAVLVIPAQGTQTAQPESRAEHRLTLGTLAGRAPAAARPPGWPAPVDRGHPRALVGPGPLRAGPFGPDHGGRMRGLPGLARGPAARRRRAELRLRRGHHDRRRGDRGFAGQRRAAPRPSPRARRTARRMARRTAR